MVNSKYHTLWKNINYPISKEQLEKVIANNVVKIRVETPIGHFDGKVYGKKFTQAITKDYKAIQKAREKETSIYDNFWLISNIGSAEIPWD